jgi:hypothetical protein
MSRRKLCRILFSGDKDQPGEIEQSRTEQSRAEQRIPLGMLDRGIWDMDGMVNGADVRGGGPEGVGL